MAIVRELITKLGFKVDDGPLRKAELSLKGLKGSLLGVSSVIIGAATGLTAMVVSAAHAGDELIKTSQKVGLSVEALQRLGYAAKLADVDAAEFAQGMVLLSRRLQNARDGSKEATKAFTDLKINPKTSGDNEKTLLALAEQFQKLPDGAKKTALAMDLFGKSGAKLIPFLNQGKDGIVALGKELKFVFSKEDAVRAEEFNDNITRVSKRFTDLKNLIGIKFLPIFSNLLEKFLNWIDANSEWIESGLVDVLQVVVEFFSLLSDIVNVLIKGFDWLTKNSSKAERSLLLVAAAAGAIALAFTPLTLAITVATALIIGFYDDINAYMEGRPSFFKPVYDKAVEIIGWIKEKWNEFAAFFKDVGTVLEKDFGVTWDSVKNAIKLAFDAQPIVILVKSLSTLYEWLIKIDEASKKIKIPGSDYVKKLGNIGLDASVNVLPPVQIFKGLKSVIGSIQNRAKEIRNSDAANIPQAAESVGAKNGSTIAGGNVSKNQNNQFKVNQTINVQVETNADVQKIGETIGVKLKDSLGELLRDTARSVAPGLVN